MITSLADKRVHLGVVLLKTAGFMIMVVIGGVLVHRMYKAWVQKYEKDLRRFVILAFVLYLLMA